MPDASFATTGGARAYDDLAEQFFDLFASYQGAHGHSKYKMTNATSGKRETDTWTERTAPTPEMWATHLAGTGAGLGCMPLREDDTVLWAAIDIDVNNIDHKALDRKVQQLGLPLVICRSKSGGAHCYLFLSDPAPAGAVQAVLGRWSAALGYGGCEIFPKQSERTSPTDIGNWLNMPYYYAERGDRYCVANGKAIEPEEFLALARERSKTLEEIQAIHVEVPDVVPTYVQPDKPKPDGEGVGQGQRDTELTRWAASLVVSPLGLCDDDIFSLLQNKGLRCDPPFNDDKKLRGMIKSARKKFPDSNVKEDESSPSWLRADSIEQKNIDWLWRNRLVRRRINLVAGLGDVGKDTFCCTLVACVTTGRKWPDGAPGCEPGDVGIFAPEDEAEDTIAPRLAAAGANLSRVHIWTRSRPPLPHEIDGLSLFVVSPLFSLLSGSKTDTNQEMQIREILTHWQRSASAQQCTIVATAHLNKKSDTALALRIIGSIATINLVRSAWLIQRDDQDKAVRVFSRLKANLSPDDTDGLRFTISHVGPFDQSIVATFCGTDNRDPDSIAAARTTQKKQTAEDWLFTYLERNGETAQTDVIKAGQAAGFSADALTKAKSRKNSLIDSRKDGFQGRSIWYVMTF